MPDELNVIKYYPMDIEDMTKGSRLYEALGAGNEVVVGPNGFIIDVWCPETKALFDNDGNGIGDRDEPFAMPESTEVRNIEARKYLPEDIGEFPEGGDAWEALSRGYQVTLDGKGFIIDIWDPVTKTIRNVHGGDAGDRDKGYVAYREKEFRNPMGTTYMPEDKDKFSEGTDAWNALNAGYQVTVDERYNIIDIWDPATGDVIDVFGNRYSSRKDPYPSDINIALVKAKWQALLEEIAALRSEARTVRGATRSKMHSSILAKQREYGIALFLYGRLIRRRRSYNKTEQHKQTKSQTPVETK